MPTEINRRFLDFARNDTFIFGCIFCCGSLETMALTIYAATTNPGKLRDFSVASASSGMEIVPLPGLKEIPAPAEDEPTFEGNARLKAVYYSRLAPCLLVMADDSGLEVDALDGAPGVRSARYALDAGYKMDESLSTDARNNLYLLDQMHGVDGGSRSARYHCVLAFARDGVCLMTTEGRVEGDILDAPRGTGGFGYDPLFYLPELGKSMAEIDLETKHGLSHRGRAFVAFVRSQIAQADIRL